jgi:hypothetical protein
MEHRLRTPQGAAAYAQRSCLIEPIFGDRMHNRGIRNFRRRGLRAVRSEWAFMRLAGNTLKLYQHRTAAHPAARPPRRATTRPAHAVHNAQNRRPRRRPPGHKHPAGAYVPGALWVRAVSGVLDAPPAPASAPGAAPPRTAAATSARTATPITRTRPHVHTSPSAPNSLATSSWRRCSRRPHAGADVVPVVMFRAFPQPVSWVSRCRSLEP